MQFHVKFLLQSSYFWLVASFIVDYHRLYKESIWATLSDKVSGRPRKQLGMVVTPIATQKTKIGKLQLAACKVCRRARQVLSWASLCGGFCATWQASHSLQLLPLSFPVTYESFYDLTVQTRCCHVNVAQQATNGNTTRWNVFSCKASTRWQGARFGAKWVLSVSKTVCKGSVIV